MTSASDQWVERPQSPLPSVVDYWLLLPEPKNNAVGTTQQPLPQGLHSQARRGWEPWVQAKSSFAVPRAKTFSSSLRIWDSSQRQAGLRGLQPAGQKLFSQGVLYCSKGSSSTGRERWPSSSNHVEAWPSWTFLWRVTSGQIQLD